MSIAKEHYESKLEVITAIAEEQIQTPAAVPMDVYLKEAEYLFKWCLDDEAQLVGKGLSWDLVQDLPARAGTLRAAEAYWIAVRTERGEAEKQWSKKSPDAYSFRNELLHELRFAYRKNIEALAAIKFISGGNGHADMLQDLQELGTLGKLNPGPLEEMNFDMTLLDRAEAMVSELAPLYAEAQRDRDQINAVKKIRDQAYTHLKEAVDTIRRYGRHLFWRNPARRKGYISAHLTKMNRRNGRGGSASAGDDVVPEIPDTPAE